MTDEPYVADMTLEQILTKYEKASNPNGTYSQVKSYTQMQKITILQQIRTMDHVNMRIMMIQQILKIRIKLMGLCGTM